MSTTMAERFEYYTELLSDSEVNLSTAEGVYAEFLASGRNDHYVESVLEDISHLRSDIAYAKRVIRQVVEQMKAQGIEPPFELL